jgi:hypothetical protein
MAKKFYQFLLLIFLPVFALIFSGCGKATSTSTPSSEYIHYTPSEFFHFNLEFDYPSYWLLYEDKGRPAVYLNDPRLLTLPTPGPSNFHPTPSDYGSIFVWIRTLNSGQTADGELQAHKQSYSITHWMTVLNDYKIMIDGYDASVLEYQTNDPETSPSIMFNRRTFFVVKNRG